MSSKIIAVLFLGILLGAGFVYFFKGLRERNLTQQSPTPTLNSNSQVSSFEECVASGNPVMESYPRRCNANDQTFTENIGNELEKSDLIVVGTPRPNSIVTSPIEIDGKARGNWFFEASFPVYLYDANGDEIALTVAQADGEWMTTEFVPFSAEMIFEDPATETGDLVLEKNNPSGLPEHDDELRIPIKFE